MFWDRQQVSIDALQAEEVAQARAEKNSSTDGQRDAAPEEPRDWDFVLGGSAAGMSTDAMAAQLEDFIRAAARVENQVLEMQVSARDPEQLVEVTVNSGGVVLRTKVLPAARAGVSVDQLEQAFTAAAQKAAAEVHQATKDAWAPLLNGFAQLDEALPLEEVSTNAAKFVSQAQQRSESLYPRTAPP